MNDQTIVIAQLIAQIKPKFENESTGHDWFHIERVWKNAKLIAKSEGGDALIIELGALLHDIADHKFVDDATNEGDKRIQQLLASLKVEQKIINAVKDVVKKCSFKGGHNDFIADSIESQIVQDADRLDAIGAIGIARTFAYGGKFGNEIYNPAIEPVKFESARHYKNSRTHTINHFYEKLLLLKDQLNTKTARALALERHEFMKQFLNQFYDEWNGLK